jgi:MinD-like ATPase involved in chromosome partitioning or flagellar assembly
LLIAGRGYIERTTTIATGGDDRNRFAYACSCWTSAIKSLDLGGDMMLLVILDSDTAFIDMLSSYIRTTELAERFTVKSFTSREQGVAFLERTRENCILLIHQSFFPLPKEVFRHPIGCTLLLSDTIADSDGLEYPVLFKFQPLNQLMTQVIGHYNDASYAPLRGKNRTEVLAIYSATGGTGKTVLSLNMAKQAALAGQNVFYFNLEMFNSASLILHSSGKEAFAQLLYYAKTNPKQLSAKIGQLASYHHELAFHFLDPLTNMKEFNEMSADDVKTIIDALVSVGIYHRIIVDLESSLHPRIIAALEKCDRLYWLVLDDPQQIYKTLSMVKQLCCLDGINGTDILNKSGMILNKHTEQWLNPLNHLGLRRAGVLPYIPQWKSYGHMEQLLRSVPFQEQVMKLLKEEHDATEVRRFAGA